MILSRRTAAASGPAPGPGPSAAAAPATAPPGRGWRARDAAVVALGILASIAAAKLAAPLLVPVVLGILASYALRPLVTGLERVRVPRAAGAALVVAGIVGALGASAWWLADDVSAAVAELPSAARKLRSIVHQWQQSGPGPISHVQEAASELGKTAAEVAGQKAPAKASAAPPAEPAGPSLATQIAENTALAAGLAGQLAIAGLLAGLMLAAGRSFRRKLVRIAGPSLARRRITLEILDEIDTQVQRQLLILLGANVLIALVAWPAFALAGLPRPALWAAVVGMLHFIPYLGSALAMLTVGVVALVQTGSLASAAGYVALTAAIVVAIGFLLTGWWQGRAVSMNAVATFLALLFFGWLWGAWGLLLGGPLMAIVKVCADRIEPLKPLGALLGD
ncbi:AI-2 transport protein TqsA [Burkholderiales bacterium]|nr:AI-2 transport protein TqsA [Burkholderiales bacterium]